MLTRFRLARHSALDETRQHADPEGRLLPPRDDAEAGYAKDLVSIGRGNGDPPNRAPELRGIRYSAVSSGIAASAGASTCTQPARSETLAEVVERLARLTKQVLSNAQPGLPWLPPSF